MPFYLLAAGKKNTIVGPIGVERYATTATGKIVDKLYEQKLIKISERILDTKQQIKDLIDDKNHTIPEVDACHEAIQAVSDEFRATLQSIPEPDQDAVERQYGRMVTDLRRLADRLPMSSRGSDAVPLAKNDEWSMARRVHVVKEESAEEALSKLAAAPRRPTAPTGARVSAEVDAWCNPCKRITTHRIIAMVGDEPKQVVCQSCDARHKFRLTPVRKGTGEDKKKRKDKLTAAQVEARKKEEAHTALQKELVAAEDVKKFNRRGRYRAGEIIEHPEHGRGKIENVIRGSILVRFRAGLRPIAMD